MILCLGSQSRIASYFQAHWAEVEGIGRADLDLLDPAQVQNFFQESRRRDAVVLLMAARNRLRIHGAQDATENRRMAENVCRAIGKKSSGRLIYFSTIDVYGSRPTLPVTEAAPVAPGDPYAVSKWEAEEFLRHEFPNDRLLVLRLPGVFGVPGDSDSAVAKILNRLRIGESPVLSKDGQVRRDYLWVGDLLRAVRHFLSHGLVGTWNLVSGESRTMIATAQACARVLGASAPVQTDPRSSLRDYDLSFNIARLQPHLPRPWPTPLEVALSSFLNQPQLSL